jgi:hypothetical protein
MGQCRGAGCMSVGACAEKRKRDAEDEGIYDDDGVVSSG